MIAVENISKSFQGFLALNQATLHVEKGSVYGLVGPNGAGKSTLIRHLTGIFRPEKGSIQINGQPVYENPAIKQLISYIPDDFFYFMQASVQDMMKYYQSIYPSFNKTRFDVLRDAFPSINEKQPIRHLSKGMQKQAAFWLAISCNPEILILDEPVDGLDPVMRRQIWSILMNEVNERKTTVFVSSHNLRELEDVCDHVGIMNKGSVLMERSLSNLQDNISKLQVAFEQQPVFSENLPILHTSSIGRVTTIIMRGNPACCKKSIADYQPLFMDALPLTLEEIFIYELGGADYGVKDIILS